MEVSQKQCRCLGANENCIFCYGSGYAPVTRQAAPRRRRKRRSTAKLKKNSRAPAMPEARCPYCGNSYPVSEYRAHVETTHVGFIDNLSEIANVPSHFALVRIRGALHRRSEALARYEAQKEKEQAQCVLTAASSKTPVCPVCGTYAGADLGITEHLLRVHQSKVCRKCNRVVKTADIDAHNRRYACGPYTSTPTGAAHLRSISAATNNGRIRATAQQTSTRPTALSEGLVRADDFERQSDGSRGYHNFRENGRFGSHPLFDAMDGESKP